MLFELIMIIIINLIKLYFIVNKRKKSGGHYFIVDIRISIDAKTQKKNLRHWTLTQEEEKKRKKPKEKKTL